jgi:RluA family pseudouridine synthase
MRVIRECKANSAMGLIEVLLDDPPCLVVNKPGGLLTQSPPGIDSLEDQVRAQIQRGETAEDVYLGLPHRLDRPASGAVVMARTHRATRRLCDQFAGRSVDKRYWVLVEGELAEPAGTWQDLLRKIPGRPHVEVVPEGHPEGRLAVLDYRTLGVGPYGSWLELRLRTGRTHQIRVQCAHRGHPVLGDAQYGSTVAFGPLRDDPRDRWIALHARRLGFVHPTRREPVAVEAPLPRVWEPLAPLRGWIDPAGV